MPKSDDLLNEIIARRRAKQLAPQQDILARVLDALNAFDTLETLIRRIKLCYGPKVISGEGRMGVVVWRRPPRYHGYKTLTLIGVWVMLRENQPQIIVGKKLLAFSAPFYDADAYHKLIRKNYDLYYNDDNQPPAAPSFSTPYDTDQRLELREAVMRAVAEML